MSVVSQLYKPYDISGQTVLITGASSGIGQDVRDIQAIQELPQQLPHEFKEVDILVNNAGLALGTAGVQDNDVEDLVQMLETNCTQVVIFTKTFLEGMLARNKGHIVNMGSVAGHESYSGGSVYCGTKHFLDAYTTAARHDLVGTNIRVTVISPGAVRTEFSAVRFKGDQAKADAVYEGIHPLTADDIADNVLYACTRPAHVQIADIVVLATYQCSAKGIARVLKGQQE
ncbi:hypothetical protein N2152v2_008935 [Parachlorella kessleri]